MFHQIANLMSSYGEKLIDELNKLKSDKSFEENKLLTQGLAIIGTNLQELALFIILDNPSKNDIATQIQQIRDNLKFLSFNEKLKTDSAISYQDFAEKITTLLSLYESKKDTVIDNQKRIEKLKEQNSEFFKEKRKESYTKSSDSPQKSQDSSSSSSSSTPSNSPFLPRFISAK